MTTLLEKLERQAGRWLEILDNQLQQPILRATIGVEFMDSTSSDSHKEYSLPEQRDTSAISQPRPVEPYSSKATIDFEQQECDNAA